MIMPPVILDPMVKPKAMPEKRRYHEEENRTDLKNNHKVSTEKKVVPPSKAAKLVWEINLGINARKKAAERPINRLLSISKHKI